MAQVDSEDWDIVASHGAGGREQSAIATENNQKIDPFVQFLTIEKVRVASILGGELVAAVTDATFVEPGEQTGNNLRGARDFRFGNDSDSSNWWHRA
jgi:hypothetical protein